MKNRESLEKIKEEVLKELGYTEESLKEENLMSEDEAVIKAVDLAIQKTTEFHENAIKTLLASRVVDIDKARADERKKVAEEIKRKYGVEKLLDDKFKARVTGHIENIYYILEKLKEECEKIR